MEFGVVHDITDPEAWRKPSRLILATHGVAFARLCRGRGQKSSFLCVAVPECGCTARVAGPGIRSVPVNHVFPVDVSSSSHFQTNPERRIPPGDDEPGSPAGRGRRGARPTRAGCTRFGAYTGLGSSERIHLPNPVSVFRTDVRPTGRGACSGRARVLSKCCHCAAGPGLGVPRKSPHHG